MRISILTPTIRKEGLSIVKKSLLNQTLPVNDWEWLIGSQFDPEIPEAKWIKDDFEEGFWSLNRIYNKLFKEAKGELFISWQDWIYIPPDGLEKFWIAYQKMGNNVVITGVGDQYQRINEFGKPEIKIWSDPRKNTKYGSFYECFPQDAEFNWCAIPRDTVFKVGGMDEQLDFLGYGGDQFQTVQRMNDAGVKFYIDQDNESFTLRHGREDFGGQEKWDKNHTLWNGSYSKRKENLINSNKWPILDYLKQ